MSGISNTKILNSKYFEPALFLAIGGGKTAYDYFSVKDKYKNRILLNDTLILAGASVGILSCRWAQNKRVVQKLTTKLTNFLNKKFRASKFSKKFDTKQFK